MWKYDNSYAKFSRRRIFFKTRSKPLNVGL